MTISAANQALYGTPGARSAADYPFRIIAREAGSIMLVLCLLFAAGCSDRSRELKLAGATMGTTWHVTVILPADLDVGQSSLQQGIEARLEAVNASMSTYRPDSEIRRFNAAPVDEWVSVSRDFYRVLSAAMVIGRQSQGAYDVTVGPLVDLWGFGPGGEVAQPPKDESIAAQLDLVGQDKLRVDGDGARVKKLAELSLDFSSIAKGFAVDQVASWLDEAGIENYLVEVGGEMRVAGLSGRGDAWRVGIEQPDGGSLTVARAIQLDNAAVATSGDYRNYFEVDGVRYSHSIDPRTGYPVAHELVSVTVVHPSSMIADGWATALVVLGATEAWKVAQAEGLAVYFIQRGGNGFQSSHTEAFSAYLEGQQQQGQ